jgi:UPF0755 protein
MISKMKKRTKISLIIVAVVLAGFFYFRFQVYHSQGDFLENKIFKIEKGEGNEEIAKNLKEKGLISQKIYFFYYVKLKGVAGKIMPGEYQLSGKMTIPEIVRVITDSEEKFVKITFPEGFTAELMSKRLTANNLPGDEFLEIVKNPGDFKKRYSYLTDEKVKTLEGYLFPDTYFFKKDTLAKDIIGRMLDTFDQKLNEKMRTKILEDKKNITEIVIMASIVEREVQTAKDMKTVAGIFWKRIAIGQRLQSDAPLSYILNDKKDSHSGKELEFDSPYNTYKYAGLPPGPIGNPGENALEATIYPEDSAFYFFLTTKVDDKKKVIYSKTFEEHVANKRKYGL